jgi:cobalt/nickel transport system permease protein
MHMVDAMLSPAVGGAFLAASGGALAYSARQVAREADERRVPLMGVLGAFVFAAQMINFSIPGTGSSGHLGGGMLLAILLGPYAAFLVISSVLVVQSLFFADGGVLALGANIFNLGVWPCFLGYLVYRAVAGTKPEGRRLPAACIASAIVSLELGALSVVLQTLLSGRNDLPFGKFALLMAGIHLPIAVVEGIVMAGVVRFVQAIRPSVAVVGRVGVSGDVSAQRETLAPLVAGLAALAILTGCFVAWFASAKPDGLEWALAKAGVTELAQASVQSASQGRWPDVSAETSVAGLLGAAITFGVIFLAAALLVWLRNRRAFAKLAAGGER